MKIPAAAFFFCSAILISFFVGVLTLLCSVTTSFIAVRIVENKYRELVILYH